MSFVREYWHEVFEPLLRGYHDGGTPNPDVACVSEQVRNPALPANNRFREVPTEKADDLQAAYRKIIKDSLHAAGMSFPEKIELPEHWWPAYGILVFQSGDGEWSPRLLIFNGHLFFGSLPPFAKKGGTPNASMRALIQGIWSPKRGSRACVVDLTDLIGADARRVSCAPPALSAMAERLASGLSLSPLRQLMTPEDEQASHEAIRAFLLDLPNFQHGAATFDWGNDAEGNLCADTSGTRTERIRGAELAPTVCQRLVYDPLTRALMLVRRDKPALLLAIDRLGRLGFEHDEHPVQLELAIDGKLMRFVLFDPRNQRTLQKPDKHHTLGMARDGECWYVKCENQGNGVVKIYFQNWPAWCEQPALIAGQTITARTIPCTGSKNDPEKRLLRLASVGFSATADGVRATVRFEGDDAAANAEWLAAHTDILLGVTARAVPDPLSIAFREIVLVLEGMALAQRQEERLAEPGEKPPQSPQSMLSLFPPVVVDELMRIINKPRNMRAAITDCVNDLVWLGHFD